MLKHVFSGLTAFCNKNNEKGLPVERLWKIVSVFSGMLRRVFSCDWGFKCYRM